MIIFGDGARQIVAWFRSPRKGTFAPGLRTTQQGSWAQWYQGPSPQRLQLSRPTRPEIEPLTPPRASFCCPVMAMGE